VNGRNADGDNERQHHGVFNSSRARFVAQEGLEVAEHGWVILAKAQFAERREELAGFPRVKRQARHLAL
jgi:hypothetical protein